MSWRPGWRGPAGYHCFNQPEMIELVEVVSGHDTAAETIGLLCRWALSARPGADSCPPGGTGLHRQPAAVCPAARAFALAADGVCGYADVDEVVRTSIGARCAAVGPFETVDLAGLDVHAAVASRLYPELARSTTVQTDVLAMVSDGRLGCKTGRGLRGDCSARLRPG